MHISVLLQHRSNFDQSNSFTTHGFRTKTTWKQKSIPSTHMYNLKLTLQAECRSGSREPRSGRAVHQGGREHDQGHTCIHFTYAQNISMEIAAVIGNIICFRELNSQGIRKCLVSSSLHNKNLSFIIQESFFLPLSPPRGRERGRIKGKAGEEG